MATIEELTLYLPNNNDLESWFSFIKHGLSFEEKVDKLILNFNNISFIEHDDLVLLACLIEHYYQKGSEISFIIGSCPISDYIEKIRFKEYWTEGFDRNKFTTARNSTTLCLWKISEEMISSYSNYAKSFFANFEQNKDLSGVGAIIEELFNNVFNHSKSHVNGYVMSQYYPKNRKLCFSVCDFGVGIPYTVNKYLKENDLNQKKDREAILLAMEHGFSIKSTPQNRGWGLTNVSNLVNSTKGHLLITSNKGLVEQYHSRKQGVDNFKTYFNGTLIKVEIFIDNLDDKEIGEVTTSFI